jgi:tetratricopeptide (TPR) repeat protein
MTSPMTSPMTVMRRLIVVGLFVSGCGTTGGQKANVIKLPAAKPEAVEALKEAARSVRLGQANWDRALERLRTAQQLDPKLWEAFYDEGWILLKQRRAEEAIAPLEKALAIYPTHAATVEALGEAYSAAGRSGDAARVFKSYIDRVGAEAKVPVRVALGAAQRRAGKLDEALETLRGALRLADKKEQPAALNQMALVYLAKQQLELADLVLRKALDVDEKSKAAADTWNNLGLIALARRRDQEAFAHFDQASRLDPQLVVARRNKAVVYLDCGDYQKAAEELKQVVKADDKDASAWVALGVAERGRGNLDAAGRAYERALDISPTGPDAADALFDLAILHMEFKKEPNRAKERFEQFLKTASASHPKRAEAETRLRELAQKLAPAPSTPAPASGTVKSGGST